MKEYEKPNGIKHYEATRDYFTFREKKEPIKNIEENESEDELE